MSLRLYAPTLEERLTDLGWGHHRAHGGLCYWWHPMTMDWLEVRDGMAVLVEWVDRYGYEAVRTLPAESPELVEWVETRT